MPAIDVEAEFRRLIAVARVLPNQLPHLHAHRIQRRGPGLWML